MFDNNRFTNTKKKITSEINFNCIICVENIDESVDSFTQSIQCRQLCHNVCIYVDTFEKCNLCE